MHLQLHCPISLDAFSGSSEWPLRCPHYSSSHSYLAALAQELISTVVIQFFPTVEYRKSIVQLIVNSILAAKLEKGMYYLLSDISISKEYILAPTLLTSYLSPQVKIKQVKIKA